MASLAENITQAIADFDEIKSAIISKGVSVPDGTPTSQYDDLIRRISGGGSIDNADIVEWALKEAGYNVSDDPNTWGDTIKAGMEEYGYKIDYSGMIFTYSGRQVTRQTDEVAYCAYCFTSGNWFTPVVIGGTANSVAYTMNGYKSTSQGSIIIDGVTIYYNTKNEQSVQSAKDTSGYNRRFLGTGFDNSTQAGREKIVRKLYSEIKMLGYDIVNEVTS